MSATEAVTAPPLERPGRAGPSRALTFARARTALALAALALLVMCSVAIALGGADTNSSIVQGNGGRLPAWMTGVFGPLSFNLSHDDFLIVFAAMGAAYLVALAVGPDLSPRLVIGTIVALHLIFLLAPPLLSTDIFNYVDYGRLGGLYGLDPYIHGPIARMHDAAYQYTNWRHTASAYGPLFTLASYPLAQLGLAGAMWAFKLLAACASLGCVALVWGIAQQLERPPLKAAAIFGLNPLLLVWTVGGGHNDLLMLMLMLAGILLVLRSREALGGAAVLAAVAVKATAGVAIPFLVLGARRRWRAIAGLAAAGVAVLIAASIAFPHHALGFLHVVSGQQQTLVASDSIPTEVCSLIGLDTVTHGARLVGSGLLVVIVGLLLVWVWRGGQWVAACGWALIGVVALAPWLLAWYTVWPLPFAAVTRDRRLLVMTLAIETYFVVNHIPHFTMVSGL
jgi:hypothetical protein